MNCPLHSEETAGILLDYSSKRLGAVDTALLERHMESCGDCAAFRDEQSAVWSALDVWEESPVSGDFNRNVWTRIESETLSPWYTRFGRGLRLGMWKPVASLAFAAAIMMVAFLLDHQADRTPVSASHAAVPARAVSVSEADQVEQALDDIQLLYQFESAAEPGAAPRKM